jgi:hypothetical protein
VRTNQAGTPGTYSCDRCGLPSRGGVWTLFVNLGFPHICGWCKEVLNARGPNPILGARDPRLVPTPQELAARAAQSSVLQQRLSKKEGRSNGTQTVSAGSIG